MKVEINVSSDFRGVQRIFMSSIEVVTSSKEVLNEVFKGRQAVGVNNSKTVIRCGDDDKFFAVEKKSDILNWIDQRLKGGK